MKTLVDSNVLLDITTRDPHWGAWSENALRAAAQHSTLTTNPIVFAEVSMKFNRIEDADAALGDFARDPLPYEAGFLAGKAFLAYKGRGGAKRSPMPDFYVGAHAHAPAHARRGAVPDILPGAHDCRAVGRSARPALPPRR